MPLPKKTRDSITEYYSAHIADEDWCEAAFDFIRNRPLRNKLAKEFWSARVVYKILEGLKATNSLKRAQIKLQILQYASIYEAVIHYLLFTKHKYTQPVKMLLSSPHRTKISVSSDLLDRLEKQTKIPKEELVVTREKPGKADITKIRFDRKLDAAEALGIITSALKKDLNEIFSARNSIHLHAEIRKGIRYQISLSKKAYRRLQPFREQIVKHLENQK